MLIYRNDTHVDVARIKMRSLASHISGFDFDLVRLRSPQKRDSRVQNSGFWVQSERAIFITFDYFIPHISVNAFVVINSSNLMQT